MADELRGPELRRMLRSGVRMLFHALPLGPLIYKRYLLVIAAILLIAIPYIKVKKLSIIRDQEKAKGGGGTQLHDEITRAIEKWRWLTFWDS
jgi:hypothetical protein